MEGSEVNWPSVVVSVILSSIVFISGVKMNSLLGTLPDSEASSEPPLPLALGLGLSTDQLPNKTFINKKNMKRPCSNSISSIYSKNRVKKVKKLIRLIFFLTETLPGPKMMIKFFRIGRN